MADFIIIIRPEPDASRDVAWLKRYQVPAIAVPVMQAEKRPFELSDMAALQAVIFTSRHAVEIGRAHVRTPVTSLSRMPSSA